MTQRKYFWELFLNESCEKLALRGEVRQTWG